MRNNRMYALMQRMNDIENTWISRGIKDATAEPEWNEYEQALYTFVEFIAVGEE